MTDVVYVLGTGSQWRNNEIRFSLRSIAKNLKGYGKIYIIGEDPGCLKNIIHIPYPDELGSTNADGNIIRKVLRACREPELSANFLFINDDHLINKPIKITAVPAFHKGDMTTYPESFWKLNPWRKRLMLTRDELIRLGLTANLFDCHTPILFNKARFPEIISRFDYASGIGLCMKSLYGNIAYPEAPLLVDQKKTVFRFFNLEELNARLKSCGFVSYNDEGLNSSLRVWLNQQFPEPSPWEVGKLSDPIIEISEYLQGEQDYETGRDLFNRHCHGVNMKKVFSYGETPQLKKKLIYKLMRKIEKL
jgi:hypothetical protein